MKKITIFLLFILALLNCQQKASETINVLYMAQSGYQPEDFKKVTELFEHTSGIEVKLKFVKYDDQYKNIVNSVKTNDGKIDVFSLDLIWTAEFASKNYCVDLSKQVSQLSNDIAPAIVDAFRYKDKIWAMPFLANFQLFFYNIDLIKKAGFKSAPKTLEEMVNQMRVMKKKGIVKYPWSDSWNQKEGLTCEYVWLTGAYGGDLFDESGKPIFNNGAGLKALQFMVSLLKEGLANPIAINSDEVMAKDTFINGQSAFTSNWTFQYALMNDPENSKVVGKAKMGLLPVSKSILAKKQTTSVSGFQGLGILSNSKNKDAAWKYIKFITSPIVQQAFLQEMPVWTSVQENTFIQKIDKTMKIKSKQIASVHHRPKAPKYPEVSFIIQKYIHQALKMKMSPKQALDSAVEEINKL